jgi:CrcB protein
VSGESVTRIALIALGGALGSVLRYLASGYVQDWSRSASFPFGTLAVNVLGCFVIGAMAQLADSRGVFSAEARALVFVGVLGGFTTFSTFSNESVNLLREGENLYAFAYVGAHVLLGLGAVWAGRATAYAIWK